MNSLLILPGLILLANIWFWWKGKFSRPVRIIIGLGSAYMLYNAWQNYWRAKDAQTATLNG